MKLFEFAIIYVPEDKDGNVIKEEAKVVQAPQTVLAVDEKAVTLKAAKLIPEDLDLDFIQVLVRPF